MKAVIEKKPPGIRRLFSGIRRFFTGHDVVISYSRWDGTRYATELASRLADAKYSCLFDQWFASPGKRIPPQLKAAIRLSSLCVVVCTKESAKSEHVKEEIEEFLTTGRSIIPIDVGNSAKSAAWWGLLEGLKWETEPESALETGEISPWVMKRVIRASNFSTREHRLQRSARVLSGVLAVLLLTSVGAGWFAKQNLVKAEAARGELVKVQQELGRKQDEIKQKTKEAADATALAKQKTEEARAATQKADRAAAELAAVQNNLKIATASNAELEKTRNQLQGQVEDKNRQLADVGDKLTKQIAATQTAQKEQEVAVQARKEAEDFRDRAVKQALEADGSRIAAVSGNLKDLRQAIIASVHDYRRLQPSIQNVAGSLQVALSDALIQAHKQGTTLGIGSYPRVVDFDVAPALNLLVTCGVFGPDSKDGRERNTVTIWDIAAGQPLDEIERGETTLSTCAFSRDFQRLVVGDKKGGLRLYGFSQGQFKLLWSKQMPWAIVRVRFAPGRQRLIAWTGDGNWNGDNLYSIDVSNGIPFQLRLPIGLGRLVAPVQFSQINEGEKISSPIFGTMDYQIDRSGRPRWTLAAVRADTGELRKWDLTQARVRRFTGKKSFSPFSTSAISPSGRWLAVVPPSKDYTQKESFIIDLDCAGSGRRQCVPVRILPAPADLVLAEEVQLGFSPDEKYLVIRDTLRKAKVYRISDIEHGSDGPEREIQIGGELKGFTFQGDGIITIGGHSLRAREIHDLPPNFKLLPPLLLVWPLSGNGPAQRFATDLDDTDVDQLNVRDVPGLYLVGAPKSRIGKKIHVWEQSPPAGHRLSSVGFDGTLGKVSDATASSNGKLVATAHAGGQVAIWQLPERELKGVIRGLRAEVVSMCWAGAEKPMLYAASSGGQLIRWQDGTELENLEVPSEIRVAKGIEVSRDGRIVLVRDPARVAIWASGQWKVVPVPEGVATALSADGQRYAVGNGNGGGAVYGLKGDELAILDAPTLALGATRMHFARSDTRIVAEFGGLRNPDVVVWDARGGKPLGDDSPVEDLPERVQGRDIGELWAAQSQGQTYLVDLRDGKKIAAVPGRDPLLQGLGAASRTFFNVYEPLHLVAAGSPGPVTGDTLQPEVQVWDAASGETRAYVPVSKKSNRVEFLASGQQILYVSPDNGAAIAPVGIENQFKDLCPVVYADYELAELEQKRPAFDFCDETFQAYLKPPGIGPRASPWVLNAPERQRRTTTAR